MISSLCIYFSSKISLCYTVLYIHKQTTNNLGWSYITYELDCGPSDDGWSVTESAAVKLPEVSNTVKF